MQTKRQVSSFIELTYIIARHTICLTLIAISSLATFFLLFFFALYFSLRKLSQRADGIFRYHRSRDRSS